MPTKMPWKRREKWPSVTVSQKRGWTRKMLWAWLKRTLAVPKTGIRTSVRRSVLTAGIERGHRGRSTVFHADCPTAGLIRDLGSDIGTAHGMDHWRARQTADGWCVQQYAQINRAFRHNRRWSLQSISSRRRCRRRIKGGWCCIHRGSLYGVPVIPLWPGYGVVAAGTAEPLDDDRPMHSKKIMVRLRKTAWKRYGPFKNLLLRKRSWSRKSRRL